MTYPASAKQGVVLGVRVQRDDRRLRGGGFTWQPAMADRWHTLHLEIVGDAITTTLDGSGVRNEGTGPFAQGPPLLLVPPGCTVHVRSARYKVLARQG